MKKRFVLIVVLLSFICIFSFIIVGIATGILGMNEDEADLITINSENTDKYIQYELSKGTLDVNSELKGYVVFEQDAIIKVEENKANTDVKTNVKIGQYVNKDDILCINGENQIKSPVNGKILSINIKDRIMFDIVDYSKSYIKIMVDDTYQNKINSSTVIMGRFDDEEDMQLEILSISPIVEDGKFVITLKNQYYAFENSEIDITIRHETKQDVVIIPKEYINYDGEEKSYIRLLENNKVNKKYVSLGSDSKDYFELINADVLVGKTAVVDKEKLMIEGNE